MRLSKLYFNNLIFLLVPFLVPLLILGSFSMYLTSTIVSEQVKQELEKSSKQLKVQFEYTFMDMDAIIQAFTTNPTTINLANTFMSKQSYTLDEIRSLNLLQSTVSSFINTKSYFHSVYIYFENKLGKFLSSTDGIVSLKDYWDSEWMQIIKELGDKTFYTCVRTIRKSSSDNTGYKVITIFIRNMSHSGWIVFNLNFTYYQEMIKSLFSNDFFSVFVFNNDDSPIISYPDVSEIPQGLYKGATAVQYNGTTYFCIDHSIEKYGWHYYVLMQKKKALALPISLNYMVLFLILISSLIGIVLAMEITKRNNRWITEIVNILNGNSEFESEINVKKTKDYYIRIVHDILQVFIEKNYLLAHRRSMELTALQAQINPHFLYNTLNLIYWETIKLGKGPSKVTLMLEKLTRILEYSISNPMSTVSLEDDINYTKDYIDIQQFRFPGKFSVVWSVSCDTHETLSMKLVLQPLVENCINHGFKNISYFGVINIEIFENMQNLTIIVRDNGAGIDEEKLETLRQKIDENVNNELDSIGLINTVRRIKLFYGTNSSFRIDSSLNSGTIIEIILPSIKMQPNQILIP